MAGANLRQHERFRVKGPPQEGGGPWKELKVISSFRPVDDVRREGPQQW